MTRSKSIWLAAIMLGASASGAMAADQAVVLKAAPAAQKIEYGNLYFGFDWTSHRSLAGYVGVLYAPEGMHKSGIRLSAFGLFGDYEYHGGDAGELFKGRFASADALIGWSNVFNNGAFTLQVGANHQDHRVRPFDATNSVVGSKTGFKVQADLWVNPTERTLVYALGSYSTAFNTYYTVGRLGYDFVGKGIFFGPKGGALANDPTDQFRAGAHLTGIMIGPGKLTLSSGFMSERNEGGGWYATGTLDFSF